MALHKLLRLAQQMCVAHQFVGLIRTEAGPDTYGFSPSIHTSGESVIGTSYPRFLARFVVAGGAVDVRTDGFESGNICKNSKIAIYPCPPKPTCMKMRRVCVYIMYMYFIATMMQTSTVVPPFWGLQTIDHLSKRWGRARIGAFIPNWLPAARWFAGTMSYTYVLT